VYSITKLIGYSKPHREQRMFGAVNGHYVAAANGLLVCVATISTV